MEFHQYLTVSKFEVRLVENVVVVHTEPKEVAENVVTVNSTKGMWRSMVLFQNFNFLDACFNYLFTKELWKSFVLRCISILDKQTGKSRPKIPAQKVGFNNVFMILKKLVFSNIFIINVFKDERVSNVRPRKRTKGILKMK